MTKNIAASFAMFPGQGSQKPGMGKSLVEGSEAAAAVFEQADKALGFSISKLCFEGPAEELTLTHNAQPAILTTSVAALRALEEKLGDTLSFSCAAGHSLGEYSAFVAAGAVSFEDAVQLVHKRGRYMQEAVKPGEGAMAAVLGMESEEVLNATKEAAEQSGEVISMANHNADGQIVVAGTSAGVAKLKEILAGAKIKDLEVSAPFHCELMAPARDKLRADLEATNFTEASYPVINNFLAEAVTSPEQIRQGLIDQVCGQVRWVDSVRHAREQFGVEQAIEFGEGKVLVGLLKRIDKTLAKTSVGSPEDLASAAESI